MKKITSRLVVDGMRGDIVNLKNILRNCFKELKKEKMPLSKLKEFLCSILYNNNEMCVLVNKLNNFLNSNECNELLYDKIMTFKKVNLNFSYGTCTYQNKQNNNITNINSSNQTFYITSSFLPYIYNKRHTHTFLFDSYKKINFGDKFCISCAWELFIIRKIKPNEKICFRILEEIITSTANSKKYNIDFFYYLKHLCFVQPLSLESSNSKYDGDVTNNNTNISTFSVSKTALGVKDFSDLLVKKKDSLYASRKKDASSLIFEVEVNENYDTINFDLKMKDIMNNNYKKAENTLLFVDNGDSKSGNSGILRFSKMSDNS